MITDIVTAHQSAALRRIFEHDGHGTAVANIGQIYEYKPPKEEVHNFCSSSNILRKIKWRRLRGWEIYQAGK
jgi:hypothetical protein